MCGPTGQQEQLQGSEASFAQTLQSSYNTNLAEQQSALAHINGILQPILEAGPNQEGFSPAETAALNTQAIDTTGAAAANSERAIANETAGRNDSGNLPQSGVDQALKAQAGSSAENQLASEELGITESDYATGRQQFGQAVAGEEDLAQQYNPVPYANPATQANQGAFGEATQIQQEQAQEDADIAGGITSLASGALGGFGNFAGLLGGGGSGGGPGSESWMLGPGTEGTSF